MANYEDKSEIQELKQSLGFKKQEAFFDNFFLLREKLILMLSENSLKPTVKNCETIYQFFNSIIISTSEHIPNLKDIQDKYSELYTILIQIGKETGQTQLQSLNKFQRESNKLIILINKEHTKGDMLPQPRIEVIDEIKTEKDARIRNAMTAYNIMYGK